jgi:hypothetical protein
MEVIVHTHGDSVTFSEFADKYDVKMVVRERPRDLWRHGRYFASFDRVDVMERGMLRSEHGNGETPEAAIVDYAQRLLGKRLAIDANGANGARREVTCPNVWKAGR